MAFANLVFSGLLAVALLASGISIRRTHRRPEPGGQIEDTEPTVAA